MNALIKRYTRINQQGFDGVIVGYNRNYHYMEYKVKLLKDSGNYKKGSFVYLGVNPMNSNNTLYERSA